MSESILRLLASPKFSDLPVPSGFDQNVGRASRRVPATSNRPADMSDLEAEILGLKTRSAPQKRVAGVDPGVVERSGFDLVSRFRKAEGLLANGKRGAASKAIDDLAEHVEIVARNARDGGDGTPTVLADTAAALLSVDAKTRGMILRRAKNPPEFEALRNAELDLSGDDEYLRLFGQDVKVAGGGKVRREAAGVEADSRVAAEEARIKEAQSAARLPMIMREGSVFNRPAKLGPKGNIITPSEQVKDYRIDDKSPLDAPAAKDKQTPLTKGQKRALDRLARDQIAEATIAERKFGSAVLPPVVNAGPKPKLRRTELEPQRRLTAGQQRVLEAAMQSEATVAALAAQARVNPPTVRNLLKAGLLDYAGSLDETPNSRILHVGTDPNYWRARDRKAGRPTADSETSYRSNSQADNILAKLYQLTAPQSALTPEGAPVHLMADNTTTIDLDSLIPWWRGRFADVDNSGNLYYPNRLPTPEFITGQLQSRLGVTDNDFYNRVLPLISRSIDAAPDLPSPFTKSDGRTAYEYSQTPFLPGVTFEKIMKAKAAQSPDVFGPTAADIHMPYQIYGPRVIDRPTMSVPERNPYSKPVSPAALDAKEEFRRRMAEPGLDEQSSIYMVPPNSPMRLLLV